MREIIAFEYFSHTDLGVECRGSAETLTCLAGSCFRPDIANFSLRYSWYLYVTYLFILLYCCFAILLCLSPKLVFIISVYNNGDVRCAYCVLERAMVCYTNNTQAKY